MIHTEYPYQNNSSWIRTYSDDETKELFQVETGYHYDEAIDIYPCRYTYTEIDKPTEEVKENAPSQLTY